MKLRSRLIEQDSNVEMSRGKGSEETITEETDTPERTRMPYSSESDVSMVDVQTHSDVTMQSREDVLVLVHCDLKKEKDPGSHSKAGRKIGINDPSLDVAMKNIITGAMTSIFALNTELKFRVDELTRDIATKNSDIAARDIKIADLERCLNEAERIVRRNLTNMNFIIKKKKKGHYWNVASFLGTSP
ncbi:23976_t:CDS:2 [Dentiscutata erythropus]|uniref:23976_t:CDS:1 n=1 Tax=Dentiscutata erythropus TaxID=1348616 RepID=A0A9N9D0J6_9GLOM|nr:23976_t:CDS:2 [Dentiscutata erythropus]